MSDKPAAQDQADIELRKLIPVLLPLFAAMSEDRRAQWFAYFERKAWAKAFGRTVMSRVAEKRDGNDGRN